MAIDLLTAALASKLSHQDSSSSGSTSSLPSVTSADNGDVLGVVSGAWSKSALKTINSQSLLGSGNIDVSGLPAVTSTDNGKALTVVNGSWTAADIPSDAFVCTFTKPSSTIACDKSRTEILAAYDAGKQVYGKCNLTSLFGSGFGGTGIFRLVNVDENNNRHVTFACEYYLPGDASVADHYALLYIKGFTFVSIYAWSAAAQDTYSIPSDGIPESDLSSNVQEKLVSQESIARMWRSTRTYDLGDLVMHNGVLYESQMDGNTDEPGSTQNWLSLAIASKYPGVAPTDCSVLMCDENMSTPYWGHAIQLIGMKSAYPEVNADVSTLFSAWMTSAAQSPGTEITQINDTPTDRQQLDKCVDYVGGQFFNGVSTSMIFVSGGNNLPIFVLSGDSSQMSGSVPLLMFPLGLAGIALFTVNLLMGQGIIALSGKVLSIFPAPD